MKVTIETKEKGISVQGVDSISLYTLIVDAMRGLGMTDQHIKEGLNVVFEKNKK